MSFPDHFSGHAALYARVRPSYPEELYDFLAGLAPARRRAWDCATGNGQAALSLATRFDEVVASDASAEQLARAPNHPKITFRQALAEASGLEDHSIDLVAVATAAHWFDLDAFYCEVRRVGRPGAVIALWSYGASVELEPAVDAIVRHLARDVLGPYWPEQFRHVRDAYRDLPFPFPRLEAPSFVATARLDRNALLGFVRSWSGFQRYLEAHDDDPLAPLEPELEAAWRASGPDEGARAVRLPLALRVGRLV